MSDTYQLLVAEPKIAFEKLATAWAQVQGVPASDAAQRIRQVWGVLAKEITNAEAERLAGLFQAAGIATVTLAQRDIHPLPTVANIRTIAEVPNEIQWLAACGYREEETVRGAMPEGPSAVQQIVSASIFMTTGLPIRLGPKKQKAPKPEQRANDFLFIEVVGANPPLRYRIDTSVFDYACLGARKGYSARVNAKQLLVDLIARAPQARMNEGARHLLETRPASMPYRGLGDLDREWLWLLNLPLRSGSEKGV